MSELLDIVPIYLLYGSLWVWKETRIPSHDQFPEPLRAGRVEHPKTFADRHWVLDFSLKSSVFSDWGAHHESAWQNPSQSLQNALTGGCSYRTKVCELPYRIGTVFDSQSSVSLRTL
jgi:hypothetical protein